jgi:hypothetical protein
LETAESIIDNLVGIKKTYENDFLALIIYDLKKTMLVERRQFDEALSEIRMGIDFAQKSGFGLSLIDFYACKAWTYILMGNIKAAEDPLKEVSNTLSQVDAVPIQVSNFYRIQLEYYLHKLKEALKVGEKSKALQYQKEAKKISKSLIKITRKAAQHRIESYKLMGLYFWLINKQKRALRWWFKAIDEGERLGARLELSRAYFVVGKHLLDDRSKYKSLNGIKAKEFLTKAKILYQELNLRWDLDELNRVVKI